ncbi:hypothetical protein BDA96_05G108500 [Sorghum bicolor]|nr:hypothetical protein BDA96_05G108500 [Sorghum bicolor]KAG0529554.1 hypothetical protein BDA96_05G108500 [Sorghum bicolor]
MTPLSHRRQAAGAMQRRTAPAVPHLLSSHPCALPNPNNMGFGTHGGRSSRRRTWPLAPTQLRPNLSSPPTTSQIPTETREVVQTAAPAKCGEPAAAAAGS